MMARLMGCSNPPQVNKRGVSSDIQKESSQVLLAYAVSGS